MTTPCFGNTSLAQQRIALALVLSFALLGASTPSLAQGKPVPLQQGAQLGKAQFEPGDTAQGGNGQPVDGIEASSHEMLKTHFHSHLSLFYRGQQIAVPEGIGIVKPFQAQNGFIGAGKAIYWVHTHDASGIIHVESPDDRAYTLANFFHIWGQPLSAANVAGFQGPVRAYVNGKLQFGNPGEIRLQPHAEITLVVGEPAVTPPSYVFPEGL